MSGLIRAFDWSRTPLGPIETWPQSLRTVTNLLLLSPVPIVLLWGPLGIMIYNDAYSGFAGGRHPALLGSEVRKGWPEVADFNDNVMKVGLAGKTLAYRDQKLFLERSGTPEPVWMNLDYSPVLNEAGKPEGVIAIVVETTERVIAEKRLSESEARFRALVNATSDVVYQMSPDWSEMRALDGRGLLANTDSPSVHWQEEYILPEDRVEVSAVIAEAIRTKRVFEHDHRVRRADGTIGWTSSRAVPVLDDSGEIVEWFGAASDITERRKAEEHLRLIVNELNHRVKNNLAMTQAIAMQTFKSPEELSDAQERFTARMVALGQATDLLTGERGGLAAIRGVIEEAVRPHAPEGRLHIEGPKVTLSPKSALALTLAMHELATNAVKYGAWSDEHGKVRVDWTVQSGPQGRRLQLQWLERNGPPVVTPSRRGFGSRLIERGLSGELGGTVKMDFAPTGLICRLDAPLREGA